MSRKFISLFSYKPFPIPILILSYSCPAVTTVGMEGSKSYMEPGELQRSKRRPDPTQSHLEARHSSLQQVIRLISINTWGRQYVSLADESFQNMYLTSGIMKIDVDGVNL
jgi:hypothetical protein